MKRLRVRFSIGLILLFVLAQTAGLVHAEIHPFHTHSAECDLYQGLAHPVDTPITSPAHSVLEKPFATLPVARDSVWRPRLAQSFRARAPPALMTMFGFV